MKLILKCTCNDQLFLTTMRKGFMKKLIIDACSNLHFIVTKRLPLHPSAQADHTKIQKWLETHLIFPCKYWAFLHMPKPSYCPVMQSEILLKFCQIDHLLIFLWFPKNDVLTINFANTQYLSFISDTYLAGSNSN